VLALKLGDAYSQSLVILLIGWYPVAAELHGLSLDADKRDSVSPQQGALALLGGVMNVGATRGPRRNAKIDRSSVPRKPRLKACSEQSS
jgi:hypothetical protein